MDESRLLITGAHGQLGLALQQRFPEAIATGRAELDLSNEQAVADFDWSKVDVILNAAGDIHVDRAESPEGRILAWQSNATAVSYLARAASQHDLVLVHISSETVFDGSHGPHLENEPLSPLGVYAQTKAAGDIAALATPKHYLLRTSWVIGEGKNFVGIMIGLAEKNISPKVVSDQTGRLTFTNTLVDAIEHLLKTQAGFGIYNVSNDGDVVSWAEVTRAIFDALGRNDLNVTGVSTEEYFADKPEAAPRPLIGEFDLGKIKATGLQLRDWRDDLHSYIQQEQAKPKEQA